MILRNTSRVALFTLISRVFGFLRDVIMAQALGAGPVADAFMVAFRLPNHFRAVLGEGAFNSAFVPTYASILGTDGPQAAQTFRSQILAWVGVVNFVLLAIGVGTTGWLIILVAPGFVGDPARLDLAVGLTRITFPYLFCLSVVILLSGVLNAHGRFAVAAGAPILLNLAMAGLLHVAERFPTAGHAAATGVLVGGVAQLLLLLVAVRRAGLPFRITWPRRSRSIDIFARRFGPAVLGAGGIQLAIFADTIIATLLPAGSISYLYYADRLYQLPLAVIGIALGTAILPDLSRRIAVRDEAGAAAQLSKAVLVALVIGIPCAVILSALGDWIIEILFGRGAFGRSAVDGSASALAAYAVGLPAAISLRALVAAFHARGDTATPVKVLAFSTAVNLALKVVLVGPLIHAGLAAATAVSAWVYAGSLAVILWRRSHLRPRPGEWAIGSVAVVGGLVMAAAGVMLRGEVSSALATIFPERGFLVPFLVTVGVFAVGYASLLVVGSWGGRLVERKAHRV
jgi:putative peptidoglycan lipid II flippase